MDITEDYVSLEVAKLLKDRGFEQEPDYATSWYANQYYKNACQGEWFEGEHQIIEDIDDKCNISYLSERGVFIPAPTLQMACKWLREVHNIFIEIYLPSHSEREDTIYHGTYSFDIFNLNTKVYVYCTWNEKEFNSYEEAVEAALKYVLENLI